MHLFLICFTLLCSVFRISMKLDIYEDAHCCTYCERNRTKRLLRHVTLNMAFLGITSRCNSHVRSLMKGRKQSFSLVMQQLEKVVHLQCWHHNQQQIFVKHQEKFSYITQSTQFSLAYYSS